MTSKKQKHHSKTRKTSIVRRPVLTLLFLLIFVGAVFGTIKIIQAINKKPAEVPVAQPAQKDNKTEEKSSEKTTTAQQNSAVTEGKTPAQYDGDNPNNKGTITGVINAIEKQDNAITVHVSIDQLFSGDGICKIEIIQNEKVLFVADARTKTSVSTSNCQHSFSLPDEKPSGKYKVKVTVTADDKSGIIEREDIL